MGQKIMQVDAFTAVPFAGNPAGVCIMDRAAPEGWMKNVAREMNLAETAFAFKENGHYRLRWFTPMAEVKLCGHATIATAHIMWEDGMADPNEQLKFETLSGILTAERDGSWIKLDFPAKVAVETEAPEGLLEALGIDRPLFVGKNVWDYLVEVEDEHHVRSLKPDLFRLAEVDARGVVVTAQSNHKNYDFISRFFAPRIGVPEDPVTGSAHCALTPYWSQKLGKTEMIGYQASERGGVVKVAARGDRVWLYGEAVTVLRGELAHTPAMP